LADRYTGRHIRAARHGAWLTKKRSRQTRQLLPAAAAMTVAGLLVGGAGTAINASSTAAIGPVADNPGDGSNGLPLDRAASADRVSRSVTRPAEANATAKPTPTPTPTERVVSTGSCGASYYDQVQETADGEMFDPGALTAASPALPFNTRVRVTNMDTGESVIVRINDRGPFIQDRCLDLSKAAFAAIANPAQGVVDVRYDVLVQDAT
jgi:rare lipoprotein A